MSRQSNIVHMAEAVGYDKFHPDWFTNNELEPKTWFLELCLIQKWMRELDHPVIIYCYLKSLIHHAEARQWTHTAYAKERLFDTFEDALEDGIYACLANKHNFYLNEENETV